MNPLPAPASSSRRDVLQAGAAGLLGLLAQGCALPSAAQGEAALPAFAGIPPSTADRVVVPPGYVAETLYRWGDPTGIAGALPAWRADASDSAADQAVQAGMHHDGMHFFPLPRDPARGLLVLNHEYTDERLLHAGGMEPPSLEKVRKSQHAMGVSVAEVALRGGRWDLVRPSPFARRIHGRTPMRIAGPAAGHALMRTGLDPAGTSVLGTFQNCAMGVTPWGTYLTCEENFQGHFGAPAGGFAPDAAQQRYGLAADGAWLPWWRFDERFDLSRHPNEANRFGWVVEIDPMDPQSVPVKRTALGRKRQESATCALTADGRVAVYMGDDGVFEYIYKFVSRDTVKPGGYAANRDLLDHGRLYAARFDAGGRGEWLELLPGRGGVADAASVCVHARLAADAAGATRMDRPEWIAVRPGTAEIYVTLTNNSQRGAPGRHPADAANPRAPNPHGHIVRWREAGGDAGAARFEWDHFVLAGLPQGGARYPAPDADLFGGADGLHFDSGGLLWIQTDTSNVPPPAGFGHNQLLCANPATGRIRRFLTAPRGAEVTGCVLTPDRRTLFVNIQHPADRLEGGWPDGGRSRSATVVVRKSDGGVVGS